MNFKKFRLLNNRLSELLDEQLTLFLFERPQLLDWLSLEQLEKQYPDLKEAIKLNQTYINSVIEELHYLLGGEIPEEQLTLIFK